MTVSDYIISFLANAGVDTAFMVTGGQAMFLNDAVQRNKKMKPIFTHHEQAAGMSAEAYGRISGNIGFALVTAGPAAINVMNGVVGAWVDSAPMIVVSGQSPLSFVQYQEQNNIRQYGIQGIYIKPMVQNFTKYFKTIDDPAKIRYYIEKAYYLATHGRPGPVWLDVPLDIQRMEVPEKLLTKYIPKQSENNPALPAQVAQVIQKLQKNKRPLLIIGQGVRLSGSAELFIKTAERLDIPVVNSRLGMDVISSTHRLFVGRAGSYGQRPAHFAIQNADLLLAVGSRLSSSFVGYNADDFGRNSTKIVVDIDAEELNKPGPKLDLKIIADAKEFFEELLNQLPNKKIPDYSKWVKRCNYWRRTYPATLPQYKKEQPINSYYFTDRLSRLATSKDIILVDTGGCFHVAAQAWQVKKNQRYLTTGGISSMGYWVAGIGACMAGKRARTLVITGDGSLQMNLQELATIKHNNLPIKIFIFNNNGYLLIRHTQKNFMDGRLIGESPKTGLWCPDSLKIAKAYGIKAIRIKTTKEIDSKIKEVLNHEGPVICDIITGEWQQFIPRLASDKLPDGRLVQKPYEDMFPFLERVEFEKANRP